MSESVRPSVPRPRTSVAPPAKTAPPPPASEVKLVRAASTLDLEDADIVGVEPKATRSVPPPVPSSRRTIEPKPLAKAAPAPAPARASLTDPTDRIFEDIYQLAFARGVAEAAQLCAETLAHALRARAVVVHTHDLSSHELRAIAAHGDGDFDVLGSKEASDDDLVASAVIANQRSVTLRFDGELPRIAPKRLHAVGAPRTLVAAPVLAWGRCLAIVEVIDADERLVPRAADSAAYVAQRFGEFLRQHAA